MDRNIGTGTDGHAIQLPAEGEADPSRAERILAAAGDVFLAKGFDRATTLDIAARARVSKRDLYRHFDSKQGILEALIAANSRSLSMTPDLGEPSDLDHMLSLLGSFGVQFLASYLDPRKIALYRIAISEAPRSNSLGLTLMARGAGPVIASATAFMTRAVERGIVAPGDVDLVIKAFFDVLIGPWHLRLLTGTHPPPQLDDIRCQSARAVEVVRRVVTASVGG